MKKILVAFASVVLVSLLSSCITNLKDNELILENNTAGDLRFDFRGDKYELAPGGEKTITGIDANKYGYVVFVDNIPGVIGGVTLTKLTMAEMNGDLDFTSKGTRVRLNVAGMVKDSKVDTTVATGYSGTYEVKVYSTKGWVD